MKRHWLLALGLCLSSAGYSLGQPAVTKEPAPANAPVIVVERPTAEPVRWVRSEYIHWWLKGAPLPPLVSAVANPAAVPVNQIPGALGADGTIIISPSRQDFAGFNGGRLTIGGFGRNNPDIGFEASGFLLEHNSSQYRVTVFGANDAGAPLLAVPFFNALSGNEDALFGAIPGLSDASIFITSTMKLWGLESNALLKLRDDGRLKLTALGGFRYVDLNENYDFRAEGTVPPLPGFGGFGIIRSDHIGARNQFWSGQFGLRAEAQRDIWFINVTGKVALGSMHQTRDVAGATSIETPGVVPPLTTFPGGYLAQVTNSGRFSRDMFVVAPDVNIQVGVDLTRNTRMFIGYEFLYLSNVLRPGDQIDRRLNPNLLPPAGPQTGAPLPAPTFNGSDFWSHGLSFGLAVKF